MSKVTLEHLLAAGSHFGHQARRWNPAMASYIYTTRDNVHIFDLAKTKDGLDKACNFLEETAKNGGHILVIATKRQARGIMTDMAKKAGLSYITERWLGGMMTNFGQLQKSVRKLRDLKDKREKGELKQYTKYEQLQLDREIDRLERLFGGVVNMEKLPDAIFVVDSHKEEVAVKEAVKIGIPVVAMVDTNGDPALVNYLIPANDDAVKSIELVAGAVIEAIESGKAKVKVEVAETK